MTQAQEPAIRDADRKRTRITESVDIGQRHPYIEVTSLLTGSYDTPGHVTANLPGEVSQMLRDLAREWANANLTERANRYQFGADIQVSALSHTIFQDESGMWRASVLMTYRFKA